MVCRGMTSEIAYGAYLVCKTEICNIKEESSDT